MNWDYLHNNRSKLESFTRSLKLSRTIVSSNESTILQFSIPNVKLSPIFWKLGFYYKLYLSNDQPRRSTDIFLSVSRNGWRLEEG